MAPPRNHSLPVESSWRMVEGEHDSFDTSIVPDEEDLGLSSPSQFSGGSQGQFSIGGSQDDNIHDFVDKAADEQVILRSPFQPSVPSAARHNPRTGTNNRSPDPKFYMPAVEIESPRRASGQSSRTIRPGDGADLRQRQGVSTGSPVKRTRSDIAGKSRHGKPQPSGDHVSQGLLGAVFDMAARVLGLLRLAFRYVQKPLAILFFFGGLIIAQNMVTESIYTSISPLCRLPGASWLNLPFCVSMTPDGEYNSPSPGDSQETVELDKDSHWVEVLEKNAGRLSLVSVIMYSKLAMRELHITILYSDLPGKEELLLEFVNFVDATEDISNDLVRLDVHIKSTINYIISTNREMSLSVDNLDNKQGSKGSHPSWLSWLFGPPTVSSERKLRDSYMVFMASLSDMTAELVNEAEMALQQLSKEESHLHSINDAVGKIQTTVQSRRRKTPWSLWNLVGGNKQPAHNDNTQLSLRQISKKFAEGAQQMAGVIVKINKVQTSLDALRDRVAQPEIAPSSGQIDLTLSGHIETINHDVVSLELVRRQVFEALEARIRRERRTGRGGGD